MLASDTYGKAPPRNESLCGCSLLLLFFIATRGYREVSVPRTEVTHFFCDLFPSLIGEQMGKNTQDHFYLADSTSLFPAP